MKCEKLNFRKSLIKASNIEHEWNSPPEIFSRPQEKKIQGNICFFEQVFYRKQSMSGPEIRAPTRFWGFPHSLEYIAPANAVTYVTVPSS